MRTARQLPDLPLDPPALETSKQLWIDDKAAEIVGELKNGSWHSYSRRLTFFPRDALSEVAELDSEFIFQYDTAVAAFWIAANCTVDVDRGEMKLSAAKVLNNVVGMAVDRMAKLLAEREYEIEVEQMQ